MYIDSWILFNLVAGAILIYTTLHTKADKYEYLRYGIEYLVQYCKSLHCNRMHFHNIIYDKYNSDYFLVLYDYEFYPVTIKLSSISEFKLDQLYAETNLIKRKHLLIDIILQEISYRIEKTSSTDGVVEYNDYCSDEIRKELKQQILEKKNE